MSPRRGAERAADADLARALLHPEAREPDDAERGDDEQRDATRRRAGTPSRDPCGSSSLRISANVCALEDDAARVDLVERGVDGGEHLGACAPGRRGARSCRRRVRRRCIGSIDRVLGVAARRRRRWAARAARSRRRRSAAPCPSTYSVLPSGVLAGEQPLGDPARDDDRRRSAPCSACIGSKSTYSSGVKSRPGDQPHAERLEQIRRCRCSMRGVDRRRSDRRGSSRCSLFQRRAAERDHVRRRDRLDARDRAQRGEVLRASAPRRRPVLPMPVSWTRTSSSSATPLGRSMRASRSPIRKIALQTIAQVSAISSTISAAAVRWRRSVERMGRKCMVISSVRLELDRRA